MSFPSTSNKLGIKIKINRELIFQPLGAQAALLLLRKEDISVESYIGDMFVQLGENFGYNAYQKIQIDAVKTCRVRDKRVRQSPNVDRMPDRM